MIPDYTYPATSLEPSFQERVQDLYSFDGRLGRQSYWLRGLLLWSFNIVAAILFAVAGDAGSATIPLVLLASAAYIACFFGSLATTVKRLHDRGRSGWFMLIALIPLVGIWLIIEVGFLSGEPRENQYGSPAA
ncbi:MAG: DUF805 domain-containing protein [Chloroflexota bacterium]|nr:DUF805 domain-containing protein [Chloroflexota bacterium]